MLLNYPLLEQYRRVCRKVTVGKKVITIIDKTVLLMNKFGILIS